MSRRKKLEPSAEGQTRFFATTIVCSDRNQHPKTVVAPPIMDSRGWAQGEILWQTGGESPITDWRPADGSKTFRFQCKRCDRDVRLTRDASVVSSMRWASPRHAASSALKSTSP